MPSATIKRLRLFAVPLALLPGGCDNDDGSPAVGTLERDRLELVAEASEPIVAIEVREGDRLAPGELLLRLDSTRLAAGLAEARALRDQARARLAELERGPRRERIEEARARLSGAQSALDTARKELDRAQALAREDFESQSRVDVLGGQVEEALARRDEAGALLEELLEGTTVEELDQARARLAAAEASLVDLEVRVERLEVRAPQAGRVDALPYELGERPPAGAVVAVMLADGEPYARVHVPAPLKSHLEPGAPARIHLDGHPEPYRGRLRWISSEAAFTPFFALTEHDRGRLSYLAEIELTETGALDLPTGAPVEVTFEEAHGPDPR